VLIDLDPGERVALLRALESYVSLLTSEAARTEQRELERDLWALRRSLEGIREKLLAAGGEGHPPSA
jgi:hypothetical protein